MPNLLDLAHAFVQAHRLHEESYIDGTFRYAKDRRQCAEEATPDADLRLLVYIGLAYTGEFVEWAEAYIAKEKAP